MIEEKEIETNKKSKKKITTIILSIVLVIAIIGISYAAWNYVFIGNANTISTGDISLDLLESNTDIITIENALPMSDNEGKALDNTFNFAVTSKTRQAIDIGYSIILEKLEVDSGYTSLEDSDIKLYLTDFTGTQLLEPVTINRIKDKVIYENTHSHDSSHETIQDKFKLRVWIDENVDASDWNAETKLQYKFRIGVRENKEVHLHGLLYNIVADNAELDTNVDFSQAPTGTNKKYTFASTKDDKYPVHYYRGEVNNNFVKFGGFCWRAVRTTGAGGTKLIYSGIPEEKFEMVNTPQSDYSNITNNDGWTFDTNDNSWNISITDGNSKEISFSVPNGTYTMKVTGTTGSSSGGSWYFYKDGSTVNGGGGGGGQAINSSYTYENLTSSNVVKFGYSGSSTSESPIVFKIQMQTKGESLGEGCPESGTATQLTNTSAFNTNYNSPAYNGYMYGTVYTYKSGAATSGSKYGKSFIYNNGTYTLTDTSTTKDNTHHYTCNNTTGTCSTVRFYYYGNYYIELTGGKSVSDAIEEMQTNTNDSTIKTAIDSWYSNNMTSYTNKLEDAPWCNDRSMQTTTNVWNENGSLSEYLYYGANGRVGYTHDSINPTYKPSLNCSNKNDTFSVNTKNGNGKLQYPVALLTADELTMAGSGSSGYSATSYLNTNQYWWSLSPSAFSYIGANEFYLSSDGHMSTNRVDLANGVRPSLSLKLGTIVKDGDGTYLKPMIVE